MAEPLRIRTRAQLRMAIDSGSGLVITDTANPLVFHADPVECPRVSESSFETKVILNEERNGSYYAVGSLAEARAAWPRISGCRSCAGAADGGAEGDRLAAALQAATGAARVRPRADPPTGFEAMMADWESSQRVALGERQGRLVLCTWPGELSAQAHAFYSTDRAERVAALVGRPGARWTAIPRPHLAYNGARSADRFYFRCRLTAADYLAGWARPEDLERAGGNRPESVRDDLWPWLCDRGYADPGDPDAAAELDRFVAKLEQRRSSAHLRPGIELFSPCGAHDGAGSAQLAEQVAERMRELAGVLREPPGPATADP